MAPVRLPQFNLYKGTGAMQLRLVLPDFEIEAGSFPKPGCIYLEMCPSTGQKDPRTGNPTYNWADQKITMKLNDKDIADFILGLRNGEGKIVHDPNAGTSDKGGDKKFLNIDKGKMEGTMLINIRFADRKAMVPIDPNERLRLGLMLQAAIPAIYGWN